MSIGIGEILSNGQLPKGSRRKTTRQLIPIGNVDALADELVKEYANPEYRKWYCKVIYAYGEVQINDWRKRAADGKNPARLFSKYAKDAEKYKDSRGSSL